MAKQLLQASHLCCLKINGNHFQKTSKDFQFVASIYSSWIIWLVALLLLKNKKANIAERPTACAKMSNWSHVLSSSSIFQHITHLFLQNKWHPTSKCTCEAFQLDWHWLNLVIFFRFINYYLHRTCVAQKERATSLKYKCMLRATHYVGPMHFAAHA